MSHAHIRGIDLSLLVALQALIEERNVTHAAERMRLSQPAMSRAFNRLREIFGDELLVRTRQGYEPTHRALHLYAELDRLLPRLNGLLRGSSFDPARATDTFRIAATDYAASVLFPEVVARMTKLAPRVALEIVAWDETVFRRLETNALDLALWVNAAPSELRTQVLFEDRFMCLVRKDHDLGHKPLTLERYLAYPHALVTLAHQRQGVVDRVLEEKGLQRRVQLRSPYFASAAWIIERSDMILTVPRGLAERLVTISRTRMLKPPIEITEFRYIQVWHPRLDSDLAHQWLRGVFAETAFANGLHRRR
ncbi:MAG TPA: LysR family transcriptional regulator [Xanthobacteraceae bacterium]